MSTLSKVSFCDYFFISLLLPAQKPSDDVLAMFSMSPQSLVSLLLLGLTLILSACIYLWVLRYVCIGCCQPVAVGCESEALAGMV